MRYSKLTTVITAVLLSSAALTIAQPASASTATASHDNRASATIAADCNAKIMDRLKAGHDAAVEAKDPGMAGTFEQSLQSTFRYVHLCDGESVSFDRESGGDITIGPKRAGTPLPLETNFSEIGTRTAASGCQYVALLPRVITNAYYTRFDGWIHVMCPVTATMRSDTCISYREDGTTPWYTPGCNDSGQINNWPANVWWNHHSGFMICDHDLDYRTLGNPRRFANGAWAGPGWIHSNSRNGANYC